MKLAYFPLVLLVSCGGTAFSAESLVIADSDSGSISEGGAAAAEASGDAAADAGDASNEVEKPEATAPATPEAAPPADVVAEPPICKWGSAEGCPCQNCWLFDKPNGTTDHLICCGANAIPNDSTPASQLDLCGPGDYPSPHKAYCDSCACHR